MATKKAGKKTTAKKEDSKKATPQKKEDVFGIDTSLIKEYAEFFSENEIAHFHVKLGGVEVEMSKEKPQHAMPSGMIPAMSAAPMAVAPPVATSQAPAAEAAEAPSVDDSSLAKVVSPIVGTFYTAASPGSPAYVKEGDVVNEETVVCIVEAMKVMNELKAGTKGRIHSILVSNGDPVEPEQPLFLIAPA